MSKLWSCTPGAWWGHVLCGHLNALSRIVLLVCLFNFDLKPEELQQALSPVLSSFLLLLQARNPLC